MDKEYLMKKRLNNELTPQEQEVYDAFDDVDLIEEILEEAVRFKGQNPSKVLPFEALDEQLTQKLNPKINWFRMASRIAAVFVVGFGLYYLFGQSPYETYNTDIAEKQLIELPDHSEVTLNGDSELRYNEKEWDTQRSVELKGEAFFDVAKGKRFDVETSYGTIRVLGTEFNVTSRDSIFSVSCYEGLVQVVHNNITTKLPAGKAYYFSNNDPQVVDIVLAQPEWLQQLSAFEEIPIAQVFEALEKQYDIEVLYNEIDASIKFSGAFEHNNLENALKEITQALNLTYTFNTETSVLIRDAK